MLDVYSGGENPTVALSGAGVNDLRSRLTQIPVANPPNPPPGLGYRGVVVVDPGGGATGPRKIRAYNGWITITSDSSTAYYQDAAGIEALLLREVGRSGAGDTLRAVAAAELAALLSAVNAIGRAGNGLASTVQRAQSALQSGDLPGASSALRTFVDQVRAQSRVGTINQALAQKLIDDATRIRSVLAACEPSEDSSAG